MIEPSELAEMGGRLLAYALDFPEAWEDHPWGESVAKVRKKVFVFFGVPSEDEPRLHVTVKLPESGRFVLGEDYAEPTGYGLGKSGWVSIELTEDTVVAPDEDHLRDLIDESYRAVAPKTLVRRLDEERGVDIG